MSRLVSAFAIFTLMTPGMALSSEDGASSIERGVTLKGRIVCLSSSDPSGSQEVECGSEGLFALSTPEGKVYRFLTEDAKTAMFLDPRVRQRLLQIRGRLTSTNALEIIKIQSIREGRLHDLYYRCEVCHITAFDPGPCWCCQDDFEFRETPANGVVSSD